MVTKTLNNIILIDAGADPENFVTVAVDDSYQTARIDKHAFKGSPKMM